MGGFLGSMLFFRGVPFIEDFLGIGSISQLTTNSPIDQVFLVTALYPNAHTNGAKETPCWQQQRDRKRRTFQTSVTPVQVLLDVGKSPQD